MIHSSQQHDGAFEITKDEHMVALRMDTQRCRTLYQIGDFRRSCTIHYSSLAWKYLSA